MLKPVYLYGAIRYDLMNKWMIENIYGVEYQAQCWSLGLAIENWGRSPDGTQKKELKFQVYLNLLGIGSVGSKPSYMSF